MPNTNNLPGSMANMAISPIPGTATSTYSGSTISLPIARQQTNPADGMGGVAIKKEGWASVKEAKNFIQPWKQKFLILRKESLDFHKAEGGKVSYTIYLKDVLNVGRVETNGIIFEIKRRNDSASNSPGDDDGHTKTLQIKVKTDDELYEWIDLIYGASPNMGGVSNPTNFSHAIHVGFDSQTGQFTGLPPEWSKLLNSSAITKEDYYRNPQAVFEVLDFYTDLAKRAENPARWLLALLARSNPSINVFGTGDCSASIVARYAYCVSPVFNPVYRTSTRTLNAKLLGCWSNSDKSSRPLDETYFFAGLNDNGDCMCGEMISFNSQFVSTAACAANQKQSASVYSLADDVTLYFQFRDVGCFPNNALLTVDATSIT
ncbi:hypothetical protein NQ176_g4255 [Zarea fungicola]|uniref:Uncharacterized protein n=1 Tax=Zarea fungicola TaxID=93591 RepID=A0ACC1NEC5_9HYPO|nr:hypothetical protein NQ176_g4255 [Lecanicillium fungicola]